MDDLIRRSDAIRLAEQGQIQGYPWQFEQLVKLPSAESEIIRCEDCKWWGQKFDDSPMGYCMAAKHNYYSTQMSDLISRLSELRSQYNCFDESERDAYHTLSEAIKALQEQKTGKWVTTSNNTQWYACSECAGAPLWDEYDQEVLSDYCPHCGAKMEEE